MNNNPANGDIFNDKKKDVNRINSDIDRNDIQSKLLSHRCNFSDTIFKCI